MRTVHLLLVASAVWFIAPTASAQRHDGFSLDRLSPAPSAEDGISIERPEAPGPGHVSARLLIDWAHAPLVLDQTTGTNTSRVGAVVSSRIDSALLLSVGIGQRFELFGTVPFTLTQSSDASQLSADGFPDPSSTALGDPALGGKVQLVGDGQQGAQVGLSALLRVPVGSQDALAGDGGVGVQGKVLLSLVGGTVSPIAEIGAAYRPSRTYASAQIGSELLFGAGVGIRASRVLHVLLELHGAVGTSFSAGDTAAEALLGGRLWLHNGFVATAGGGLGLTKGVGVPDFRLFLSLGYATPRQSQASSAPPPEENTETTTSAPAHVVAPPDRDHDGVPDDQDQCPDRPEDRDGYQDSDGCPDPDNDGDGIPDATDQCPNQAETRNGYQDDDGCPEQLTISDTMILPPTPILFPRRSARIPSSDDASLTAVADAMKQNASLQFVQVEGHASPDEGSRRHALRLSAERAHAVVRWLEHHGVDSSRLGSAGSGTDGPVQGRDRDDTHRRSRRVEFRIVERSP